MAMKILNKFVDEAIEMANEGKDFHDWLMSLKLHQIESLHAAITGGVKEAREAAITIACHFAAIERKTEEFTEREALDAAHAFYLCLGVAAGVKDKTMELKGRMSITGDTQFRPTKKGKKVFSDILGPDGRSVSSSKEILGKDDGDNK